MDESMYPQQAPSAPPPAPKKSGNGWLIAVSIIVGIVLACGVLPVGFVAVAGMLGGSSSSVSSAARWEEEVISGSGSDRIVVINVSGTIGSEAGGLFSGGGVGHSDLLSQIEQATEDEKVKAVVLRVDSPGGGVVASNELYVELKKLQAAGKPLVVSMGSTAASGGYYISAPADKIFANADTFTGSLGVIMTVTNYAETYEKLGLKDYVFKSGEFKDIGSGSREPSAEEAAILQSIIDDAYQGFVDIIAEGRGLSRDEVLKIADGRIYNGSQALALGLIDELGGIKDAIASAQSLASLENALVVQYTTIPSFGELLFMQANRPAFEGDLLGLEQLTNPQAPRLEYRWMP
jgi:protease-4